MSQKNKKSPVPQAESHVDPHELNIDITKGINPARWPINNPTVIYLFAFLLLVMGYMQYQSIPKENFPEIKFPQMIIQTVYPGTSPENMENLVTNPIEKEIKNLSGLKDLTSNSFQDFSVIIAEFTTDTDVEQAMIDVKDAVDKAKQDLPTDLPADPSVKDIDVSEIPILYVNVYGNYDYGKLNDFAEAIQDSIENLKEIKTVDIVGAPEREMLVSVDLYKMQSAGITFGDIENTIRGENLSATAGTVEMDNEERQISIKKEFRTPEEIADIYINNMKGGSVRLGDIADISFGYEEQESFARLYDKNVLTLNVIKASGENLIAASDKIFAMLDRIEASNLPKDVKIEITGDQSEKTRSNLHELINTIIIGFLLVTLILMFFMGSQNAAFVALSVPLSCAIAFIVFPIIGFTLNMIVLFAFLLALGIVVDDAIVVIENTHRIFQNGKIPIKRAALIATQEVFMPVVAGTLTTLMPFVPLAFWPGTIGKFMFYLPITLIITLVASLLVAYIINPVFAVSFMKPQTAEDYVKGGKWNRNLTIQTIIFVLLFVILHIAKQPVAANLSIVVLLFILLQKFWLNRVIYKFQNQYWPYVVRKYSQFLRFSLNHSGLVTIGTFLLLILSVVALKIRSPKVEFFPGSDPNQAFVYLNLPVGVDASYTNEVLQRLEDSVNVALDIDPKKEKYNPLVSSIISNVTIGATNPQGTEIGDFPNKGKITVSFVKFADRHGGSTAKALKSMQEHMPVIPGADISVEQDQGGPPTGLPVVVELTGDNLEELSMASDMVLKEIKDRGIKGLSGLNSDFQKGKPEIIFDVDRNRLNAEGISTGQLAQTLRTAVFGKEVSRYREDKDDYPINVKLKDEQNGNVDVLRNLDITYRDMAMGGQIRQVPINSFVDIEYATTYGSIKRKDMSRIITVSSDVLPDFNANQIVQEIQEFLPELPLPAGVSARIAGEQEEQQETMGFLGGAFGTAIALMFLIIMIQFNSYRRTIIILSEIVLALIGVFFGIAIFNIPVSIVMVGVGVVALGGIVVRNGILLIEFADQKLREGLSPKEALVQAGEARMTPVLLTATATILGLIPLAVGLNIDFETLLAQGDPNIYFGGDNVAFWGPLSWTMIFGLAFGTILTLVVVPVFLEISLVLGKRWFGKPYLHDVTDDEVKFPEGLTMIDAVDTTT